MRKKRKGSEIIHANREVDIEGSICESRVSLSNLRPHYSLEDCARLKKRYKEDAVSNETVGSCMSRPKGIATTAPPCGLSSMIFPTRGVKRKIGCIDIATQMGRKNKIDDDYVAGEKIGKGKFGSVWLCQSRATGGKFACKTLVKGEETVHREVEIMQHLSGHPGVVMLKAVYEDSDCFHLVMELCSGGRLIDQMANEGPYSEQRAANVFKELILVIKYCHEMGVVHRDIKPENILLSNSGKIKLADFGLALRIANGQKLSGLAGSPAYVAPEVLLDNYSEKVDVWSAGILLHALLTGSLPFQGESLEAVFEAIKTSKLDFRNGLWESISKPAKDLIERILTRDAAKRISADEVLRHPWILFYTERTLRTLSFKAKSRSHSAPPPEQSAISTNLENVEIKTTGGSFGTCANSAPLPGNETADGTEKDDCDFVDALAIAISHVKISEPKRSRLCGPTSPIREQCSSNLQSNNLCRAF